MNRGDLLKKVSPCGLLCYTCTAAKDGVIQEYSQVLLKYLDSFDSFAERFSGFESRLKKYPEFKDVLLLLSEAGCEGCRGGNFIFPDCPVCLCIAEKGYDFCFECDAPYDFCEPISSILFVIAQIFYLPFYLLSPNFLSIIMVIVYLYLLSCIIIFIYKKFKK